MSSAASPRILLLGGHGKVSLLLTPLLLARSWHVISVIRNPAQKEEILALQKEKADGQGKLEVLVESLEDTKTAQDAKKVIDRVKPDWIVWSAGSGGKGGAERTFAVDRDAAKAYIEAGFSTPSVKKFLLVSYIASRRNRPAWWTDEDWSAAQSINNGALATYFKAKVDADEFFAAWAEKRRKEHGDGFQAINLRPGSLTDHAKKAKITLGKTSSRGDVTRADVAEVAVKLLERDDTRGYYDLLEGDEEIDIAIERVVKENFDSFAGEDAERIYQLVA